ncbi:MAG: glutamine-hydrolyzing GMP synthase subunit GuaA [Methanothrix sp.]|jgi:GMP synthase (glutamine-hydrolysing)|uniref:GMP synthase [glutamine-hydrolyzing] subunit B n=1 Tax=Methanothrix thermoacetophila (strain DSM 6194 / JCM 14653 / NBRC 101360 / PT) TaxID=349307 RepID=A0B5Q0_METTP|nr:MULTISPECIES: glutamine-hydrolyzing GMP synthase [Methanothrix]ABK14024.1 GMP synthase (glutamine-hydrolyzing) [Methanothrix thermoacetophila PT]MBC7079800.1 glutamine-hydrolyzing GMP synthase subunit GuaA [Methanothrix sp.]NPU87950.1 glutamine-hydrolyzing GMP synthase subunit GuaA [Methanothrix sp.]
MDVQRFIDNAIDEIRREVKGKAIIALSGGVDSSVCAVLAHRALGENLVPVYVDSGLMRRFESERIVELFSHLNLMKVDASERFLNALRGVTDPEQKRKIIGETFIRVFEEVASEVGAEYLIQGTIYPDRIESEGGIKSHHNVGGLPLHIEFKGIIEPMRDLYKDEVREVARALGLPMEISERMPYPGPGLAVRIVGEITREKLEVVRTANAIVEEEISSFKPWQAFAAVIGKATGVKGDNRVYGWVVAVRAVTSRDAMTADVLELPWGALRRISSRITGEIPGVSRVVYDITPKPPGTIEFE